MSIVGKEVFVKIDITASLLASPSKSAAEWHRGWVTEDANQGRQYTVVVALHGTPKDFPEGSIIQVTVQGQVEPVQMVAVLATEQQMRFSPPSDVPEAVLDKLKIV